MGIHFAGNKAAKAGDQFGIGGLKKDNLFLYSICPVSKARIEFFSAQF